MFDILPSSEWGEYIYILYLCKGVPPGVGLLHGICWHRGSRTFD